MATLKTEIPPKSSGDEQEAAVAALRKVVVGQADARCLADEWLSSHTSENTKRSYSQAIRSFFEWCATESINPLEADRSVGSRFHAMLMEKDLADSTIAHRLVSVRQFYEYWVEEEVLEKNPMKKVRHRYQPGDSPRVWVDEDDGKALLAAVVTSSAPLRDYVMFGLMYFLGLRVGDVCGLRIEGLGWDGGYRILRYVSKGRKAKKRAIPVEISVVLDEYLAWLGSPQSGPLIVATNKSGVPQQPLRAMHRVSIHRRLKKLVEVAGLDPEISPHSLRRNFATSAFKKGVQLHVIQQAMGHANPATTMAYNQSRLGVEEDPAHKLASDFFGTVRPEARPQPLPAKILRVEQAAPAPIPLLAEPVPDRLEEARRFAERPAEQRENG